MRRCRVVGTVTSSGGSNKRKVRFVPEQSGWMGSEWVTKDPVEVVTDDTGAFSVLLVPSSVVGSYLVIVGGTRVEISVPEEATARFESILTRRR